MFYTPYMYPPPYGYPYYQGPMYYDDRHFENSGLGSYQIRNQRKDYGPNPFTININQATKENNTFRNALWTGKHLQVTLMSIEVGDSIGLENHPNLDQFLRIEQGQGVVQMGKTRDNLGFVRRVADDSAIVIPAGTWHNVTNTGNVPLKLYSIYAPPQHPFGTVHETKADALAAEAAMERNSWYGMRNFSY